MQHGNVSLQLSKESRLKSVILGFHRKSGSLPFASSARLQARGAELKVPSGKPRIGVWNL